MEGKLNTRTPSEIINLFRERVDGLYSQIDLWLAGLGVDVNNSGRQKEITIMDGKPVGRSIEHGELVWKYVSPERIDIYKELDVKSFREILNELTK